MLTATTVSVRKWKAGTNVASPLGSLEELSTVARFARGKPIYLNGDPADFWYRILSGASRKSPVLARVAGAAGTLPETWEER